MKKILLLLLLSPATAFAQADAYPSMGGGTLTVFIFIGVAFLVFLILRELFCWYWKINKIVANQEETIRLLKKIAKEDTYSPENQDPKKPLYDKLKDANSLY